MVVRLLLDVKGPPGPNPTPVGMGWAGLAKGLLQTASSHPVGLSLRVQAGQRQS